MHELSICRALLKQAEAVARQRQARAIDVIRLHIGPLSGVEAALLEQVFPLARRGTLASEARLVIRRAPVRVHCAQCDSETEATVNCLVCAQCGNWRTRLVSGNEMILESVGLIIADPPTTETEAVCV